MIPIGDDNPIDSVPVVTMGLIVTCVAAFLWQLSLGAEGGLRAIYGLGMVPAVLLGDADLPPEVAMVPPAATLVTSAFLHGSLMHLLGNMLYLWIFGDNVEDAMGPIRFTLFYLVCGAAAALSQAAAAPAAEIPMIGASGAVSGVLGAYIVLYPHARIRIVFPIGFYLHYTYLPAMVALGFWMVIQVVSSLAIPAAEGGTAWFAHIGGFAAGVLLIPLLRRRGVRLFNRPRR